jgi:aryl-alcohol dehydrogenase
VIVPARDCVVVSQALPPSVLAALPCGLQTGAGAILNSLALRAGECALVFGAGAVGLAAIMAARVGGAAAVIAVDVQPARLQLALAIGATHALDARDGDVAARVRSIAADGAQLVLDTSGRDAALREAMDALATGGRLGLVTVPDWGRDYRLPLQPLFERAGSLLCIIQGSARPREFLPRLMQWQAEGRFPAERLVSTYPFVDIDRAIADTRAGRAVKAVLLMS